MTRFFACVRTEKDAAVAAAAGFDGLVGPSDAAAGQPLDHARMETTVNGARVLILDRGGRERLHVVADRAPAEHDLATLEDGLRGVLVTAGGRLLDAVTLADLGRAVDAAHRRGLLVAFGGGLEPPDVPRLLVLRPDMLLFGRALRRDGVVDADCAAAVIASRAAPAAPTARPGTSPRDRIFVRGLVRDMAIGAYASERGRSQRVRVSIEADLDPLGHVTRGMGDVVSYNLLADTVDRLIADRHIDFVETLAEEVAAQILLVPRIAVVRVRVEKLDLGAEAFGVDIERTRP